MIIDVNMKEIIEWTDTALKLHDTYIEHNDHVLKQVIRMETSYDAMDHRLSLFVYVACVQENCDFDLCVHTEVEDL